MKVVVDVDRCERNALCTAIAPEVFELRGDNLLHILDERPPEHLRAQLEEAVMACPQSAISLHED